MNHEKQVQAVTWGYGTRPVAAKVTTRSEQSVQYSRSKLVPHKVKVSHLCIQ